MKSMRPLIAALSILPAIALAACSSDKTPADTAKERTSKAIDSTVYDQTKIWVGLGVICNRYYDGNGRWPSCYADISAWCERNDLKCPFPEELMGNAKFTPSDETLKVEYDFVQRNRTMSASGPISITVNRPAKTGE